MTERPHATGFSPWRQEVAVSRHRRVEIETTKMELALRATERLGRRHHDGELARRAREAALEPGGDRDQGGLTAVTASPPKTASPVAIANRGDGERARADRLFAPHVAD